MSVGKLTLPMSRWLVEKRLSQSAERLKRLRAELEVVDEQLLFFTEAADEARLRALVSETPWPTRNTARHGSTPRPWPGDERRSWRRSGSWSGRRTSCSTGWSKRRAEMRPSEQ